MLKKFVRTFLLFIFVFSFTLVLNMDRNPFRLVAQSFSFSKDWFPFQDSARLERLNKVLYLIQESYVEPERVNFSVMYESAIDLIASSIARVSVERPNKDKVAITINGKKKEFPAHIDTMFALRGNLQDSIKFIQENVTPDYTSSKLEEMAIDGVLDTLDPHSTFLSNELYAEMQVGTSGKFGGLGIVIGLRDAKLTVISPIDETPASRAGILPGDHIVKIESETTIGMALSEAVEKMRGDKGSPITISIERKGWVEPKDIHLIRDIIRVASVESGLLPHDIGYVKVKNFQEDTTRQLKKALGQLTEKTPKGLKGLILDLRYNPGGLLDQAIDVSDTFLEEGTIVTTVGLKNKMRDSQLAELKNTQPMYPMVVVVNEGSASASEIVAGALQRNQRAIVLGQKTFGKGTVQTLYDLPQKSALKLTVAKYLTPGDISIQSIGIAPDVQTVPVIADAEQITFFYTEDEHGEAELDRHFTNDQKPLNMEPAASVAYLFQKPKEEELEKEYSFSKLSLEGKQKKLLSDFETRTSFDILTQTTGNSKPQLIEASKKAIALASKTQDQQINVAMQKLGIDWSVAPKIKKNQTCKTPDVSFMVLPAAKEQAVHAGDKIEVQAIMKNESDCTLYQAKATSKSDSGFFDHREVFFGKLAPNQTVSRKMPLALPKYIPAGSYSMEFKFEESNGVAPKNQDLLVSVLPNEKPMYSFNYEISDAVENQNGFLAPGIPERGEKFYLKLKIKNIGPVASSKEIFVSTKQEGDKTLQLEKGREKLEQMIPGQEREVKFLITVPQKFDEPSFNLNVAVADTDFQAYIQKKINVKIFQAKIAEPKEEKEVHFFAQPTIALNNLPQLLKQQAGSATVEGMIKDDVSVQDMYIMVNNKKVLYHPFQNKNKSENFSFSIPLKKGKNDVIVVARDDQDLIQTYTLNILGQ